MSKKIINWFFCRPNRLDCLFLSLFTITLTLQPYYLYQTINLFELGLYLPGIDAVLHGLVPYRDFFYLRGPFELYMPAFLMHLFGEHLAILSTYFYIGTVVTLITCVLIACQVLPVRLFLYCFVPVLIGRTFPRVVFTYWGGMRYGWGLLAVFCLIQFFKKNRLRWLIITGVLTAIAGLTSIEIGASIFAAAVVSILFYRQNWQRQILAYLAGMVIIALPYFLYLAGQHAFWDYASSQWVIATSLNRDFLKTQAVPSNIGQFFRALVVMSDKNFRQMTPIYSYLVFLIYIYWRQRRRLLDKADYSVIAVAVYGLMIYSSGFRSIWSSVFEMSLQPEKIVLFYTLTRIYLWLISKQFLKKIGYILIAAVIASSLGYSISRFSKRFFVFWRNPFKNQPSATINLPRIKGMVLPKWQADDFIQLKEFAEKHTSAGDPIWMYPELGAIHFIIERKWIGKFPTATLAWFTDTWYEEYMDKLTTIKPRYAIFERQSPKHFEEVGLSAKLRNRFKEQIAYLMENYSIISSTPSYDIYARNEIFSYSDGKNTTKQ